MRKQLTLMTLFLMLVTSATARSVRRWDFTRWSAATVENLKAEAAKGITADDGAAWSDVVLKICI